MMSNAIEVDHPLIKRHVSRLRDVKTDSEQFRALVRRLAVLLAYEATQDLVLQPRDVITPMASLQGHQLAQRVGIIPILRAGLGMVEAVLDLVPEAEVWHLGLYRDEATAQPVEYYSKLPNDRPVDVALVLDPMLATGGSALAAVAGLRRWGVPRIKLLSIIASRHGMHRMQQESPDTQVYVCAVDDGLNDRMFIVPGLGDAGDRTFNT